MMECFLFKVKFNLRLSNIYLFNGSNQREIVEWLEKTKRNFQQIQYN